MSQSESSDEDEPDLLTLQPRTAAGRAEGTEAERR